MAADNASGGRDDYATGADTQHSEPENYPDSLCNNKSFVFVHGYNVNPEAARGWNSEMFKRLYQTGSKAKFVGTTWNGAETQIPGIEVTVNFHKNVDHAFQTAKGTSQSPGLATYINSLGGDVILAAHSLGNMVVSSAMERPGSENPRIIHFSGTSPSRCGGYAPRTTDTEACDEGRRWHWHQPGERRDASEGVGGCRS